METRRCCRCETVQPMESFAFRNKAQGLRHGHCKSCEALAERRRNGPRREAQRAIRQKAKFWMKVRVAPADVCWEWLAFVHPGGYGRLRGTLQAHRVAYEYSVGPIPEGLHLDHLCRNRRCVNPAHLEPVTPRENCLRGVGFAAVNAKKTHCSQGHPFNDENTRIGPNGRSCIECNRIAKRRYRVRNGATPRVPAKCGTDAGYQKHWRLGEESCDSCRVAHNERVRLRYAEAVRAVAGS